MILDLGCGSYKITGALGIDLKKDSSCDIRASIYRLPFSARFDVIYCREVIEHLARPLEALQLIRQLLKPGGLLYLSVPNMLSIDCMLRFAIFGRLTSSEEHIYSWTIAEIRNILDQAGFQIISLGFMTPTQYYPGGRLIHIFRFLPRLGHKSIMVLASPRQIEAGHPVPSPAVPSIRPDFSRLPDPAIPDQFSQGRS